MLLLHREFRLLKLRLTLRLTIVLTLLQPVVLLVLGPKNGGRKTVVGNMTMPTDGLQQVPIARGPTSYLLPLMVPFIPVSRQLALHRPVVCTPRVKLVLLCILSVEQLC